MTSSLQEMRPLDKLLSGIDLFPWSAIYRFGIGFAVLPAMQRLLGQDSSGWMLVPFLLGMLLMLRVTLAVVRKLLPFSEPVRSVWAERRQMGKRHDSYQWRKLFWIGVGLLVYTLLPGQFSTSGMVISLICVVSGAVGLVRWRELECGEKPVNTTLQSRRIA